jgi:hypothetical protein
MSKIDPDGLGPSGTLNVGTNAEPVNSPKMIRLKRWKSGVDQ